MRSSQAGPGFQWGINLGTDGQTVGDLLAAVNWPMVVTLLTAITSLIIALQSRHKLEAEAEAASTIAYLDLVKPQSARIDALEKELEEEREERRLLAKRVDELETENDKLWEGVIILSNQLESLGHVPAWKPE